MAATSSIRGRHVSIAYKEWDGFTGRDGPVEGGRSCSLWVVTDGDDECVKVWVAKEDMDRALAALDCSVDDDGLLVKGSKCPEFGARIEYAVRVGSKNSYRFIDRPLIKV